ncbi:DUF6299 family protein [Nocardia colli]|uniref:DUF6299 family protein n=1 Tax=Nocardia colli TaxID=2545717 RepID=UPI0035D5E35D
MSKRAALSAILVVGAAFTITATAPLATAADTGEITVDKTGTTRGGGRATITGTASCTGGGDAQLQINMAVGENPYTGSPLEAIPCDGKSHRWTTPTVFNPLVDMRWVRPGESWTLTAELSRDHKSLRYIEDVTVTFTADTTQGEIAVAEKGKTKGDGTATLNGTASCKGGGEADVSINMKTGGTTYRGESDSRIPCDGTEREWKVETRMGGDHKVQAGESGKVQAELQRNQTTLFGVTDVTVAFEKE